MKSVKKFRNFILVGVLAAGISTAVAKKATRVPTAKRAVTEERPLSVMSWNVKHLGRDSGDLETMAKILESADIVALQEVNIAKTGQQALKKIADAMELSLKEDICEGLSEIPTGSKERYAYLWKDARIAYVKADGTVLEHCPDTAITIRLGVKNAEKVVREPAFGTFQFRPETLNFVFASVHLLPSGKRPQDEVPALFDTFTDVKGPLIIGGDFNLAAAHPVFVKPTKEMGFKAALAKSEKTSLKMKKRELNKAYDNFFFRHFKLEKVTVINLYETFPDKDPKEIYDNISDHCPILAEFSKVEDNAQK